jgi:cardiolipin synthase
MQQNTSWHFYLDSESAWDAMLESCEKATQSIDLEQFVFRYDKIGHRFIDVLRRKAREGIKVRIIFDAAGAYYFYTSPEVDEMRKDGIKVVFFNPILFTYPKRIAIWYFRNHRKLLIIDKKIAFTGGICIGEEMKSWRETHVRIEGPVLADMCFAFDNMWMFTKELKIEDREPAPHTNNSSFRYITNSPLINRRMLYREVWSMIEQSKDYILLTTPYFLPDNRILRALKNARKRGVEICILIPEHSNHPLVDYGSHSYYDQLLRDRIRIYRYKGGMIHSKTVIFDGTTATVGSLNFDNISLRFNFEANIISTDAAFIEALTLHFRHDLELAERLTLDAWCRRPLLQKFMMWLVWPIRKFQ